jgi:hypothetical protein
MKSFLLFCFAGAITLSACSGHKQPSHSTQADSLAQASPAGNAFFPVADYLEAEILHVDSSLLALKKITTRNGHSDTAFIQLPEFNRLAIQFVPKELADSTFEKEFTETSFQDKATRSITFTYAPANRNMELQRVDVLTIPGLRAQQVKSIYLEKSHTAGDSVILQKLFWTAQQSFEIATQIQVKGKPSAEEQVRVVWNEPAEED